METIEQLIGERVRELRNKLGLSQGALAKSAKTSLTTINRLEKGRQLPHRETRIEIAKALGVDFSELFTLSSEEKEESKAPSKAELFLRISGRLSTLNETQLSDVDAFLDALLDTPLSAEPLLKKKGS